MASTDHPICKICGERHALRDGHKLPKGKGSAPVPAKPSPGPQKGPRSSAAAVRSPARKTRQAPAVAAPKPKPEVVRSGHAVDLAADPKIAKRKAQIRDAVARHRAKKAKEDAPA